jgi:hypothetical protein
MIQKFIKDLLAANFPSLEWTIENYTGSDNTGTVLMTTPSPGNVNDERDFMFPSYQVYLRSSDFGKVEFIAYQIKELLDKRRNEVAVREFYDNNKVLLGTKTYNIFFIDCDPPIRVGREGKHMDYSINFKSTIREAK